MWTWIIVWFVAVWVWALVTNYRVAKREREWMMIETRHNLNLHYQDSHLPVEKWVHRA
jgi:hypothetical protein